MKEHKERAGLVVHLSNYTDRSNNQGDVAGNGGNGGNARVGSTTSFAGVAVATRGWLAIIFEHVI